MSLLTNFKKPIWLFIIGMIIILLTVLLKTTGTIPLLHVPMFVFGFTLELIALVTFFKKRA
jgi:membrane-bound ClpP family serine protease